jgi:hypothetical protein
VPDLHDKQSPRAQKIPRSRQNLAHESQAVPSSVEGKAWFPPVFGREAPHCRGSDVGRIGDDQIVSRWFQAGEQITPHELNAIAETVGPQIPPRDGERGARQIGGVHDSAREGQRE